MSPADGIHMHDGIPFDVIADLGGLDPFLVSLVSSGDVWAFLGSHGGITAGRRNADGALFPYYTEDKLQDLAHTTGPLTVVRSDSGVWRPLTRVDRPVWMAKSALSDEAMWGEIDPGTGLVFTQTLRTSPRHGLYRECRLHNPGTTPVVFDVLDGLQNVVPAGTQQRTQNELSLLLDAYKYSEIDPGTGLGIFGYSSMLTDLAEPAEALEAAVVWRVGPAPEHMMSSAGQLQAFLDGAALRDEHSTRGRRGAHLSAWSQRLEPGESVSWVLVADTGLDTAAVADLHDSLRSPHDLLADVSKDLEESRSLLRSLLGSADSQQVTGEASSTAHHLASVLFNVLRGGVPLRGHAVDLDDFVEHLHRHNRPLVRSVEPAVRQAAFSDIDGLLDWARTTGDPDVQRLAMIYLPLSFSRRHGDPSRPWNAFDIVVRDDAGRLVTGYQGNWRDIFQNWEALAASFPRFTGNMVATFLNATTIDGYNPYRLTHAGVDWEEPEPENPWANIGYWGDHQIVYLLRLLESAEDSEPGALRSLLHHPLFTSSDVPYRIRGFDQTLRDPFTTIDFDEQANALARERASSVGGDGLLKLDPAGHLLRTTLEDKLLTLAATKLSNLVPDGGIWMNTQRPEWNDANNALAGWGLSVVTMAQLIRFLDFSRELLGDADATVRDELFDFVHDIHEALGGDAGDDDLDPAVRLDLLTRLGRAGERYRARAYGSAGTLSTLPNGQLRAFLDRARGWLARGVLRNRREDGLFHSYNVLEIQPAGAGIRHLPLMLEGQVAVLGSGLLTASDVTHIVRALRSSALYRPDQDTYILYPDKVFPGFLERNSVPAGMVDEDDVQRLLSLPGQPILRRDSRGDLHFAAGLRNAVALEERMRGLGPEHASPDMVTSVLGAYEETFRHRDFTGRSGTFFAFEGLGSVYWHMVSKLALAVLEQAQRATDQDADHADEIWDAYRSIRAGLGFTKTPADFGAFPSDPYSHTPAHSGAKQPGMTGQAKEDVLMRLTELGVEVVRGTITFRPDVVEAGEWLEDSRHELLYSTDRAPAEMVLGPGELGFTLCGTPVVYERAGDHLVVSTSDGRSVTVAGTTVPRDLSQHVLARDGQVVGIRVAADRG